MQVRINFSAEVSGLVEEILEAGYNVNTYSVQREIVNFLREKSDEGTYWQHEGNDIKEYIYDENGDFVDSFTWDIATIKKNYMGTYDVTLVC